MMRQGGSDASGGAAVAILVGLGLLAASGARVPVVRAEPQSMEQLEAAVVMTFARFVEWSPLDFASAAAPIVVGVVANEGVAEALETSSRGKNVAGRTIDVSRGQWDSDVSGLHMLFIGDLDKRHLEVLLARASSRPIVTVSPLREFGRAGGMITLTFTDGRITFAVNSGATALSGVRLSSFLLSHATKVSDESSGGAP
jgi:hypothetical protein